MNTTEVNIEVSLNINNPIGLLSSPNNLLIVLKDKYEKKCYMDMFIVTVDNIVKRSMCIIDNENPSSSKMNIIFSATIYKINKGDILLLTVNFIGGNIMNASKDHIMFKSNLIKTGGHEIKEGNKILGRCMTISYNAFSDVININGIIYYPLPFDIIEVAYDMKMFEGIIQKIEKEQELIVQGETYKLFKKLLFANIYDNEKVSLNYIINKKEYPQYYSISDNPLKLEFNINNVQDHSKWKGSVYKFQEHMVESQLNLYLHLVHILRILTEEFKTLREYNLNSIVWNYMLTRRDNYIKQSKK